MCCAWVSKPSQATHCRTSFLGFQGPGVRIGQHALKLHRVVRDSAQLLGRVGVWQTPVSMANRSFRPKHFRDCCAQQDLSLQLLVEDLSGPFTVFASGRAC